MEYWVKAEFHGSFAQTGRIEAFETYAKGWRYL